MLPKVVHDESAAWPPEPTSGVRVRSANFDRELSTWFEELAATGGVAAPSDPPPEPLGEALEEETRSARIPFLIF